MFTRLGGWLQLSIFLSVMWTVVAITSGWLNLPRAQHMPHDPGLVSKLSNEAAAIMRGNYVTTKPVRGALVWSESPRIIRMANDALLTFPATTTNERAEFVASEYHQLLTVEAASQRWPYLARMLAFWLVPIILLLAAGVMASQIGRARRLSRGHTASSRVSFAASPSPQGGGGIRTDAADASTVVDPVSIAFHVRLA